MKLKDEDEDAFKEGLIDYEMDDEDDLKKTINKLNTYITKANNKKLGIEESETKVIFLLVYICIIFYVFLFFYFFILIYLFIFFLNL